MRVEPAKAQGSFGMPPELKAQLERQQQEKRKKEAEAVKESLGEETPVTDLGGPQQPFGFSEPETKEAPQETARKFTVDLDANEEPGAALKSLGVEISDDDIENTIFKGFFHKDVLVVKNPKDPAKDFKSTFKTLTGEEYDQVDELVMGEVEGINVSRNSFQTRQNMWTLAFGVSSLAGRPVCKPVLLPDGKNLDLKATARAKREILGKLSPAVLTKMMRIHGLLTAHINNIVHATGDNSPLKRS